MKVLITGAAGFVGGHVVKYIREKLGWDIIGLCRLDHAGDLSRISEYNVKVVYHDLRGSIHQDLAQRIGEVDYIIHLAANSHVDRSIAHPMEFFQDNVIGTVNLLNYAREHNPHARLINFSTDEVFGPAPDGHNFTENERYRPSNPYSASKAGQSCAGHSFFVTYDLPVINTYSMNIFGEHQNSEKLVSMAIRRIMNGEAIEIHSKLSDDLAETSDREKVEFVGQRHWIYAQNVANGIEFLLKHGVPGGHYNIIGFTELHNDEMVNAIGEVLGKEPIIKYVDFHRTRPGHDRRYALDGSKMRSMGWKPPVDFMRSLDQTVKWELER